MIDFSITTPERLLVSEKVDSLTLPTEMGEITVLTNHIPLVANLVPGEIRYIMNGKDNFFAVSGGFIEVKEGNKVLVLADTAEFGQEIDLDRAEKAKAQAQKLMQESYTDEKTFADAAAVLEKNLARLRVARKHRTHTHRNLESGTLPK
jgi:F-type H+-transporting ATPase subunit epsilon